MTGLADRLALGGGNFTNDLKAINRLKKEVSDHASLVVGVDFDNTLYDFHNAWLDLEPTIKIVKAAHEAGIEIFIFTANVDHDFVRSHVKEILDIDNVQINTNSLEGLFDSRKPFYSLLLDDRAGLKSSLWQLAVVLDWINDINEYN